MPTNHYFQSGDSIGSRSEQDLLQQLTNECIQIAGQDFIYIPRQLVNLDEIFHEDTIARFADNYVIEMYIENYESFLGNGESISKFGFLLEDQMRLIVSKERFSVIVGEPFPKEGDLLYYATAKHVYEIKFVDDKNPLFPLGTRAYYTLVCEVFKHSHETFATNTEVDTLDNIFQNDGTTSLDPFAKNTTINSKKGSVLDTSETNPYGNP